MHVTHASINETHPASLVFPDHVLGTVYRCRNAELPQHCRVVHEKQRIPRCADCPQGTHCDRRLPDSILIKAAQRDCFSIGLRSIPHDTFKCLREGLLNKVPKLRCADWWQNLPALFSRASGLNMSRHDLGKVLNALPQRSDALVQLKRLGLADVEPRTLAAIQLLEKQDRHHDRDDTSKKDAKYSHGQPPRNAPECTADAAQAPMSDRPSLTRIAALGGCMHLLAADLREVVVLFPD